MVLVRQRPGSSNGVVFMTLEDETGIANIVVWPQVMASFRKEVMGARLILIEGYIQSSPEGVTHLVAQRLVDRSPDLVNLANDALVRKHVLPYGGALNDDRRDHPEPRRRNPAIPAMSEFCRRRGIFIEVDQSDRVRHSPACPSKPGNPYNDWICILGLVHLVIADVDARAQAVI